MRFWKWLEWWREGRKEGKGERHQQKSKTEEDNITRWEARASGGIRIRSGGHNGVLRLVDADFLVGNR